MRCLYCGKIFEPDRITHKCCSLKCQRKYYNQNHKNPESKKEWEKKQRDSLSDWWVKKCILIRGKGKIKTKQITKEMIEGQREQLLECKDKRAERKAYRMIHPPVPKELTRVCIICGKTYDVKRQGKSLFCSDPCRNKDSLNKYYLNQDSILADRRKEYKDQWEQPEPFECKECGKTVVVEYGMKG